MTTTSPAAGADFDELVRRAAEARDQGDAEQTLALLEEAYGQRPLPEVLNNIGRTLEELGRYDEAADAYRRVIDDPSAKPALIDLDRQRLAALEPKLGKSWLVVRAKNVRAFLDGDPIASSEEVEIPLGPHMLEISEADEALLVFFTGFPSQRKDVVRTPRERLETDAVLDLSGASIDRLFINDRPIGSPLERLTIALPSGTYRLRAEIGGALQSKQIRVGEGRTLLLRDTFEPPAIAKTATMIVEPEPPSIVGPVVLGAAGVIAAGVGAFLIATAERDRNRVRDAGRAEDPITSLTMVEARSLEMRANERATGAVVAFSAAGALGMGAFLWYWLDF